MATGAVGARVLRDALEFLKQSTTDFLTVDQSKLYRVDIAGKLSEIKDEQVADYLIAAATACMMSAPSATSQAFTKDRRAEIICDKIKDRLQSREVKFKTSITFSKEIMAKVLEEVEKTMSLAQVSMVLLGSKINSMLGRVPVSLQGGTLKGETWDALCREWANSCLKVDLEGATRDYKKAVSLSMGYRLLTFSCIFGQAGKAALLVGAKACGGDNEFKVTLKSGQTVSRRPFARLSAPFRVHKKDATILDDGDSHDFVLETVAENQVDPGLWKDLRKAARRNLWGDKDEGEEEASPTAAASPAAGGGGAAAAVQGGQQGRRKGGNKGP